MRARTHTDIWWINNGFDPSASLVFITNWDANVPQIPRALRWTIHSYWSVLSWWIWFLILTFWVKFIQLDFIWISIWVFNCQEVTMTKSQNEKENGLAKCSVISFPVCLNYFCRQKWLNNKEKNMPIKILQILNKYLLHWIIWVELIG